jgi:hypothetical protein
MIMSVETTDVNQISAREYARRAVAFYDQNSNGFIRIDSNLEDMNNDEMHEILITVYFETLSQLRGRGNAEMCKKIMLGTGHVMRTRSWDESMVPLYTTSFNNNDTLTIETYPFHPFIYMCQCPDSELPKTYSLLKTNRDYLPNILTKFDDTAIFFQTANIYY